MKLLLENILRSIRAYPRRAAKATREKTLESISIYSKKTICIRSWLNAGVTR